MTVRIGKTFGLALAAGAAFLLAPTAAHLVASTSQPEFSIIVDRKSDSVELFMSFPAENLQPLFGHADSLIAESDGTVDLVAMRDGTWTLGDALLSTVTTQLGAEDLPFEGMSLMVHPNDYEVPFRDPIDGSLSVAVCNVAIPDVPPTLADLTIYAAYHAMVEGADEPITLSFPKDDEAPSAVDVAVFQDGILTSKGKLEIASDGTLIIGG
ncbi:MAG: hypothetical protein AAF619_04885 [Pseudomonadota bacterium]